MNCETQGNDIHMTHMHTMRMQVAYYEIRLFIAVGGPKLPLHTKDLAFLLHTTCKRLKYAFCILMKTNSVFVVLVRLEPNERQRIPLSVDDSC